MKNEDLIALTTRAIASHQYGWATSQNEVDATSRVEGGANSNTIGTPNREA
jgi:hypothetical protein